MDIIVGSTSALHWGILKRDRSIDLDIWTDVERPKRPNEDVSVIPSTILQAIPQKDGYAFPDALYTIKCAHLGWDILFEKHKRDILVMKMLHGCKIIPNLYTMLVSHWREVHGNKDFLSLYKDKTQFFNDYVGYKYDHDYLHELVAHPLAPAYSFCLKEGHDVAIDKAKFDMLSFEEQVRMFREEITVIACERWLIPEQYHGKINYIKAYQYALRKTVTQLTKNWATDFLVLNLEYFCKPDYNQFKHLITTLEV